MEWFVIITVIIFISLTSHSGQTKKLERKIKKLEQHQRGGTAMSKIISDLIGKTCKIETEENWGENSQTKYTILEADDEWIKLSYFDKKNISITKIIRIDTIENIELI